MINSTNLSVEPDQAHMDLATEKIQFALVTT